MRLIDADELIEHAWRDKLDSRELIVEMIEKAPTIKEIPAKIPIDIFEKLVSQEPCEDSISRQAVLSKIKEVCFSKEWLQFRVDKGSNGQRDFLINYIEQLPSVTPQTNTEVLDKIRVEIMDFEEELFHRPNTDYADYAAVRHCVEIIDKYKAERVRDKE